MKKWFTVFMIVIAVLVFSEFAHLFLKYIFITEVSRSSIVSLIALFLSVAILVFREN